MTRRLTWLISSATAALLAMAVTLFPVQGAAANRTSELLDVRSQAYPITINSQLIKEYPQTHQSALPIKDSSDKTIALQQSRVYTTTTSGYQIRQKQSKGGIHPGAVLPRIGGAFTCED